MPVDIALAANTPTAALEFRQAQPLPDGRRLAAFLVVRSGAFAAALPFVVARDALARFNSDLHDMHLTRQGEARLAAWDGSGFVRCDITDAVTMRVSGELHEDDQQHLHFAFATPCEGAATLHRGIHDVLAERVE